MKKATVPSFLLRICTVLCICFAFCICTGAADAVLSPGLKVIRAGNVMIKTADSGDKIAFTSGDFAEATGITQIEELTVVSLPEFESGVLKFGTLDVFAGQQITSRGIESLNFYPSGESGEASFVYRLNSTNEDNVCRIYWQKGENHAPTCTGMKLKGIKNTPLYSAFAASDPENDDISIEIISQTSHGLLTLDGSGGYFKYSPSSGFTGSDSFVYRAVDKYGNASDCATVSIRIEKAKTNIVYSDMSGNPAQTAALHLAEKNILIGEQVGNEAVFCPDKEVTKGDFLVMAMKACNYSPNVYSQSKTSFRDDARFSASQRNYIATAEIMGIIKGGESVDFEPDKSITYGECAIILEHLLELKAATPVFSGGMTEAQLACKILAEHGISGAMNLSESDVLCRWQAAMLLENVQ